MIQPIAQFRREHVPRCQADAARPLDARQVRGGEGDDPYGAQTARHERADDPEQFRVIGWVKGKLFTVIYEAREDMAGEYYHLVTLWKSTKQEEELYEKNS